MLYILAEKLPLFFEAKQCHKGELEIPNLGIHM